MKYCEDLNLHKIFGLKISLKKALILMNISRNDESITIIEDILQEIEVAPRSHSLYYYEQTT